MIDLANEVHSGELGIIISYPYILRYMKNCKC